MSIYTGLPHGDLVHAGSNHWDEPERHVEAQQRVQEMSVVLIHGAVLAVCLQTSRYCCCRFAHGYDAYMKYAFPHDELRPLSKTWTDSLGGGAVLQRGMLPLPSLPAEAFTPRPDVAALGLHLCTCRMHSMGQMQFAAGMLALHSSCVSTGNTTHQGALLDLPPQAAAA